MVYTIHYLFHNTARHTSQSQLHCIHVNPVDSRRFTSTALNSRLFSTWMFTVTSPRTRPQEKENLLQAQQQRGIYCFVSFLLSNLLLYCRLFISRCSCNWLHCSQECTSESCCGRQLFVPTQLWGFSCRCEGWLECQHYSLQAVEARFSQGNQADCTLSERGS